MFRCFIILFFLHFGYSSSVKGQQLDELLIKSRKLLSKKPDSAIIYSQKAFELAMAQSDYWAMSKCFTYKGRAFENKEEPTSAILAYFEALHWSFKSDTTDYFNSFTVLRNIAAIQTRHTNYEQALIYYDSAQVFLNKHLKTYPQEAKKYGDEKLVYTIKYFEAIAMRRSSALSEATDQLISLVEDPLCPMDMKLRASVEIAVISLDLEGYEIAREKLNLIIESAPERSVPLWEALHNLGVIEFRQGNYEKASLAYRKAAHSYDSLNFKKRNVFISLLDLGESYLELNEYQQALRALREALSIWDIEPIESDPTYFVIYQFMSRALIRTDPDLSEVYSKKYTSLYKSFYKVQLKVKEEHARNEILLRIKGYNEDMLHKEKVNDLTNIFVFSGFGVVVLVVFMMWIRQRRIVTKKGKQRFETALKIMNRPRDTSKSS